jgi:hypothetical protein
MESPQQMVRKNGRWKAAESFVLFVVSIKASIGSLSAIRREMRPISVPNTSCVVESHHPFVMVVKRRRPSEGDTEPICRWPGYQSYRTAVWVRVGGICDTKDTFWGSHKHLVRIRPNENCTDIRISYLLRSFAQHPYKLSRSDVSKVVNVGYLRFCRDGSSRQCDGCLCFIAKEDGFKLAYSHC